MADYKRLKKHLPTTRYAFDLYLASSKNLFQS